jgi:hypothetical protein
MHYWIFVVLDIALPNWVRHQRWRQLAILHSLSELR